MVTLRLYNDMTFNAVGLERISMWQNLNYKISRSGRLTTTLPLCAWKVRDREESKRQK